MSLRAMLVVTACLASWPLAGQTKATPPHDHEHESPAAEPRTDQPPVSQDYAERMLVGLSPNLRQGAGVIRWKPNFTYDTVKPSTNRIVCFDRSEEDRRNPYAVQCTSEGNLPRVAQNRRFRAESKTNDEEQAKVAAAEKNGSRVKPETGSLWININGPDAQHLRTHTTVAVPGSTGATFGLPDGNKPGVAWVMDGGTTAAHIMLPGQ